MFAGRSQNVADSRIAASTQHIHQTNRTNDRHRWHNHHHQYIRHTYLALHTSMRPYYIPAHRYRRAQAHCPQRPSASIQTGPSLSNVLHTGRTQYYWARNALTGSWCQPTSSIGKAVNKHFVRPAQRNPRHQRTYLDQSMLQMSPHLRTHHY